MSHRLSRYDITHGDYNDLQMDWSEEYGDPTSRYYGNPKLIQDPRLVPQITLESLGFSVAGVKQELTGLGQMIDPVTNKPYPDSLYKEVINRAVSWAEQEFDIVIRPRVVKERDDYNKTDYTNYMYLRTNARPILQVQDCRILFNNDTVTRYPDEWIKATNRFGIVQMQPTALMAATSGGIVQTPTLLAPFQNPNGGMSYGNDNFAPQLIGITYIAGMLPRDKRDEGIQRDYYVPYDLRALVSKQAAIEILERWGRNVLGAGIAGYRTSIDGISSEIESTQSPENTASSAEIANLQHDMQKYIKNLRNYYGYNMGILS